MNNAKNLKVFYSFFKDSKYIETIKELDAKYNWSPVVIQSSPNIINEINHKFTKSLICDLLKIRRLEFNYNNFEYCPIDSEILSNLSDKTRNFLSFCAIDVSGKSFSFKDRIDYFYTILNYWNTLILHFKPDVFVNTVVPHDASNYALYLLCKYHYKIPVIFLDEIFFFDKQLSNIGISVEDGSASIFKEYKSLTSPKIDQDVISYLKKIRSKKADIPKEMKLYFQEEKKKNTYFEIFKNFLKTALSFNLFKDTLLPYGNSFKKKIFNLTHLNKIYFDFKVKKKFDELEQWYENNSINQLEDDTYIYYPAPFHPESISNVRAGCYEDPFLILEMLIKILPKGYKIYYKEHPAMWYVHNIKKLSYRDNAYYNRLKKLKNVKLVSSNISTFKLIDNCKAVATATATTGWESVIRGKPVFSFSKPWYSKCSGVFEISSLESLSKAMEQVENNFKPDHKKVDLYAQSIYNISSQLPHVQPIEKYFLKQEKFKPYIKLAHEFRSAFLKNYEEK